MLKVKAAVPPRMWELLLLPNVRAKDSTLMALKGHIKDMPLVDLIDVFQIGAKSGVLYLAQNTQLGLIYVTLGRLVDALVLTWPERTLIVAGDAAVSELLQWQQANFVFRYKLVERPSTIVTSSAQLIRASQQHCTAPPTEHSRYAPAVDKPQTVEAYTSLVRWPLDLEPADIHASEIAYPNAYHHAQVGYAPARATRTATSPARSKLIATVVRRIREL